MRIRCLVVVLLLCSLGVVRADEPMPLPSRYTTCGRGGAFCADLDPARGTTVVRAMVDGRPTREVWSMPGWYRVAALSRDGEHLVTGYDGLNLIPTDYKSDLVMLSFYHRGRLVRSVSLGELLGIWGRLFLRRTVSHHAWGEFVGMNEKDQFVVRLNGGRRRVYDVKTGQAVGF
jgi:hypothetical protein